MSDEIAKDLAVDFSIKLIERVESLQSENEKLRTILDLHYCVEPKEICLVCMAFENLDKKDESDE